MLWCCVFYGLVIILLVAMITNATRSCILATVCS